MEYCGNDWYPAIGCGQEIDPMYDDGAVFYVKEFGEDVDMHVHCADLAGLDI